MGPLTDTQREKETEMDGRREAGKRETGARWEKRVFSIYGQSLYRFNLPVTARPLSCSRPHNSLFLPAVLSGGGCR